MNFVITNLSVRGHTKRIDSKRADETPIINSRKPTRKVKEEGKYLREF